MNILINLHSNFSFCVKKVRKSTFGLIIKRVFCKGSFWYCLSVLSKSLAFLFVCFVYFIAKKSILHNFDVP